MPIGLPEVAFPETPTVFRCPVCDIMIEHTHTRYTTGIGGRKSETHVEMCVHCHLRWIRFKEEGRRWTDFKRLDGEPPSRLKLLLEAG